MIVRKAVEDDAEKIANLFDEKKMLYVPPLSIEFGDYYLSPDLFIERLKSENVEWFLSMSDDLLLGCISIEKGKFPPHADEIPHYINMKKPAYIEQLCVRSPCNDLIAHAESEMKKGGVDCLWTKTWMNSAYSRPEHRKIGEACADEFKKKYGYDGLRPNTRMVWVLERRGYEPFMHLPEYKNMPGLPYGRLSVCFRKYLINKN
jgi:hypothetical protein